MPVTSAEPVTMLDHALRYASLGYAVVPLHTPAGKACSCRKADCTSVGKHPRTLHGLNDATLDEDKIRTWWNGWPDANIGISCGPSGLVVIDIDPKNGGDYHDLAQRFGEDALDTCTADTGGGGWHLVYRCPPGVHIGNVNNSPRFTGPLGPGIDVRAEGGYIVAPPSKHASGYIYDWEVALSPLDRVPARLPDALLDILAPKPTRPADDREPLDMASILAGVPAGERDWQLFLAAAKLRGADVPRDMAYALIEGAAAACVPPFGAAEARRKVDSAYDRYPAGRVAVVAPAGEWSTEKVDEATGEVSKSLLIWAQDLDSIPDVEWLIDGVMPCDGLGMIFGKHRSAKTFVMLDIACCIAQGRAWKGHDVRKGKVVYVYAEGIRGLRKRLRAWEQEHGEKVTDVAFVPRAIHLLSPPDVDFLIERIRAEMGDTPALIIIDTLARAMTGGDENATRDMGVFIDSADRLKRELGCSVWFVHHMNKVDDYRGNSALPGALDTSIRALRGEKKGVDDDRLSLRFEKQKDAEELEDIKLVLRPVGDSLVPVEFDMTQDRIISNPNEESVLKALREAHPTTLRNSDLQEIVGREKSQIVEYVNALMAGGFVYRTGETRSTSYGLTSSGFVRSDVNFVRRTKPVSSDFTSDQGGLIGPPSDVKETADATGQKPTGRMYWIDDDDDTE